jgi:hypothetical protein
VSVHYGSPVWSILLSPIYEKGIKWGSRGFKWERIRAVGDSPTWMPATVGVFLMFRFSLTTVNQEFARQTLVASGAEVILVR